MLKGGQKFKFHGKEYQVYKIKRATFKYYRQHLNNNKGISYEKACCKLTRNIVLSQYLKTNEYGKKVHQYGNLLIYINDENEKVKWLEWLENRTGDFDYDVNENDKIELEEILGLRKKNLDYIL